MISLGATLLVSLSAASAGTATPSAAVTCADEPTSHLGAWVLAEEADADSDADQGPVYATPAEVECPTPRGGAASPGDATCEETPPPDLWYRVSSAAAGEQVMNTLVPGRRARPGRPALAAAGSAPDHRQLMPAPHFQPVALCAVPLLLPSDPSVQVSRSSQTPPARILAPPDRPPRV
jgi:hypothetical protein